MREGELYISQNRTTEIATLYNTINKGKTEKIELIYLRSLGGKIR